jgi:hypothetical protein
LYQKSQEGEAEVDAEAETEAGGEAEAEAIAEAGGEGVGGAGEEKEKEKLGVEHKLRNGIGSVKSGALDWNSRGNRKGTSRRSWKRAVEEEAPKDKYEKKLQSNGGILMANDGDDIHLVDN